jgi:hypothetical protein
MDVPELHGGSLTKLCKEKKRRAEHPQMDDTSKPQQEVSVGTPGSGTVSSVPDDREREKWERQKSK